MLIRKTLLAAAAVMTLAVPAAAMAQDYGGYHSDYGGGYRDSPRAEYGGYEHRRAFAWRRAEREREIRREMWRSRYEHRHFQGYRGGYQGEHAGWDHHRAYDQYRSY